MRAVFSSAQASLTLVQIAATSRRILRRVDEYPSTLSASLWSGLCYLINLIEERPFLLFLKNAIWVFFLGVNVFPSTKCCISHTIFHVFYASRSFSFFLFSGLRFPHGVRPCQLLCWRRPRWFSTSSDLRLFSLSSQLCAEPVAFRTDPFRLTCFALFNSIFFGTISLQRFLLSRTIISSLPLLITKRPILSPNKVEENGT